MGAGLTKRGEDAPPQPLTSSQLACLKDNARLRQYSVVQPPVTRVQSYETEAHFLAIFPNFGWAIQLLWPMLPIQLALVE